jgi:hypothetical protein
LGWGPLLGGIVKRKRKRSKDPTRKIRKRPISEYLFWVFIKIVAV